MHSEQFNELLKEWIYKVDGKYTGLADGRDNVIHCCWSTKSGQVTNTRKGELLEVDGRPFGIEDVEKLADNLKQFMVQLNRATMPLSGPEEAIAAMPLKFSPNCITRNSSKRFPRLRRWLPLRRPGFSRSHLATEFSPLNARSFRRA
jgi:hypothetical protein